MKLNTLDSIRESLVFPNNANVLINGALDLKIIKTLFSPEQGYNFYINSSYKESDEGHFSQVIESLTEDGFNVVRTSRSEAREKKVITPKSFSIILDMGHDNSGFSYTLNRSLRFSDKFDDNEDISFDLLSTKYKILKDKKDQLSSIRGSLAAGLISADDVPKNLVPLLNAEDKELEQSSLLEAIKKRNTHIANVRSLIRDYGYLRKSTNGITTFSSALKDEGVYIYISDIDSADADIAFPITRNLDDTKAFLFRSYESDIHQSNDYIFGLIGSKKKQKEKITVNTLGSTLGAFFSEDMTTLSNPDSIDELYGNLKELYEEQEKASKEFVHYSYLINALYHTDEEPMIKREIPSTLKEDVEVFRIGTMTLEELNQESTFSRLVENHKELEELNRVKFSGYSPTALHDGHIALLLTSGLLNSYVGKGEDQHLIKGTTHKSLVNLTNTQEERKSIESYAIELVTLNRDGVFKTIL